ncbi:MULTISPECIES: nucleotidyl transferase AbiEii/AbiGii toxin family protein [Aliarcobacter]|jgi:predicted nucleotidyltransferase component of viral defense system|uniref:nucleotidyl transferase AbiEii/AbiGii toxin family protein n=1 Tax=Aliarcobacter TaxID=2321111 RepID=UPI0010FE3C0B|nr:MULTISPECIES: nucleotidyl transferase AbiEii/AbiGii toxin family protein [Aliarcobacter]TLT05270.1 nucleotidyl transferase AbiEii/AbiGii toxin family protein [Aliarcobacter cibarius]
MLEKYQEDRINLMKSILPYFGDNFVLKGGTALSLYYGLNRYSEDIDITDNYSQNILKKVEILIENKNNLEQKNF